MLVSSEREAPLDVHTDSGEDAVAVCFQGQELPTWVALLRVACSKYGTASVKGHQQLQRDCRQSRHRQAGVFLVNSHLADRSPAEGTLQATTEVSANGVQQKRTAGAGAGACSRGSQGMCCETKGLA